MSKETWDVLKGLYETTNANQILFLKTKLLSIKMEANESISNFISPIKDLSDKLGDIGEKVSNSDLVTITLKGLVQDYQVFISSLSARPKPPTFDELTGILLQEEERMKNFELDSHSSYLALIEKGKQPYRGKPWDKKKASFKQSRKVWLNLMLMIREMLIVIIVENHGILLNIVLKEKGMSPNKDTKGIMEILHRKTPQSVMDLKILSCLSLKLHCLQKLMIRMLGLSILVPQLICLVINNGMMNIMRTLMEHTFT
jgi:hypothetical protein